MTSSGVSAPDPPWWDPPGRGEPRTTLTRDKVVTAALHVLDEVGLQGFTMRRVAQELGTGAATIYWHIADKEQLLQLVLDRVIGEIELPEPDSTRWQDQIREFARAGRAVFRDHPGVALASLGRTPVGPNLVPIMEWFLRVLGEAGVPPRAASWFADLLALVGAAQAVEDGLSVKTNNRALDGLGEYLAQLPADQFPQLTSFAAEMARGDADDRSEFALELLIRGLASYVRQ